ncbi:hypothetical protein BGZ88_004743, partial [Linnemannia elongata]
AAAGKTITTIIDEPFVFQAAYNVIKNEYKGFYKHVRQQIYRIRNLKGRSLSGTHRWT